MTQLHSILFAAADPIRVETLAAVFLALAVPAAYILKVVLDHRLAKQAMERGDKPAGQTIPPGGAAPTPSCKFDDRLREALIRLEHWHAPEDPATGRQSWKSPRDHHRLTEEACTLLRELARDVEVLKAQSDESINAIQRIKAFMTGDH